VPVFFATAYGVQLEPPTEKQKRRFQQLERADLHVPKHEQPKAAAVVEGSEPKFLKKKGPKVKPPAPHAHTCVKTLPGGAFMYNHAGYLHPSADGCVDLARTFNLAKRPRGSCRAGGLRRRGSTRCLLRKRRSRRRSRATGRRWRRTGSTRDPKGKDGSPNDPWRMLRNRKMGCCRDIA
jgi:hypothetical protein